MNVALRSSDLTEITALLGDLVRRFEGRTVLVTGAAGFLGRYFCDFFELLNDGILREPCHLILCDNFITGDAGQFGGPSSRHARFIQHDVVQPLPINEPLDYIIHAAGVASPQYYRKYPLETLDVATQGTRRMLELAREKDVTGILYFSSSEIYGDPDPRYVPIPESYRGNVSCTGPRACYDESKRLGETLCSIFHSQYGVKTRTVRPFNVYGPGMQQHDYRVLPQVASHLVRQQPMSVYGSGKQTRTFTYITDAINGFLRVLLLGHPGDVYNIGNPTPEVSMLDLLRAVGEVIGRDVPYQLVDYPDTYPADEPLRRCPDISKATIDVAFQPQVDLPTGLRRYLDWAVAAYR